MLKKLFVGLLALIAILVVVGFLLPDDFHLERSVTIDAPACTIFAQLDNFHRFNAWSPWADIDPNAQYSISGTPKSVGHKMSWASEDRNVGTGSQEITALEPYRRVESLLDFGDQGQPDVFFDLQPEGDAVKVVWGFDTSFEGSLIGRYFGLFFDNMIGPSYEKGLSRLKAVAEALPDTDWCDADIEITEVAERTIASTEGESGTGSEEVSAAIGEAYGKVLGFLGKRNLQAAGAPLTINKTWGEDGYQFEAAMPLATNPNLEAAEGAEVVIRDLPATRAVRLIQKGSYSQMEGNYAALEAYLEANGLNASGHSWAEYLNDPATVAEEELVTHIYIPVDS
ncbi:MAG: SRPBCC family protein [Deltaproteobacteria bacterium]|nr:SRPBCC family protein [Deltaproteobacteria bacterium]